MALTLLQQFMKELQEYEKHTTPTGTPSLPYYSAASGGLFGVPGLERDILSTRIMPKGIAGALPAIPTTTMNPRFGYILGYDAGSGSNPVAYCDDAPIAGPLRTCIQTADFGRYERMTREFDITRVGEVNDRSYFTDLQLVNDPLINSLGSMVQPNVPQNAQLVGRETLQRFIEVGVSFQNLLSQQLWRGNPVNNTASGGYQEFPGLDILIGTNKVDAVTGALCPALNSDVKNYNYQNVATTTGQQGIVNVITYIMRMLQYNADRMGMNPVTWTIAMRQSLFWEITAMWPCSYLSYRCGGGVDNTSIFNVNVDASDQVAMRDAMRNGMYLTVDGVQYPVVIDDAILEETQTNTSRLGQGQFASDIYFIPMTIGGGMPVTFWQYFNFAAGPMQAAADGNVSQYYWTDGGKFMWHAKPPRNWCVQWLALVEPRVVMLTPHLAGRLQHVMYMPLQHERTPFPGDPYNLAGGTGGRTAAASLYAEFATQNY